MQPVVLIVDDEEGLLLGLKKFLEVQGYRVLLARTASEAREILIRHEVDIALLDLRLGKDDGMSLLAEMVAHHPHVAVLVITGYGDIPTAVECMRMGARNFLTKPVDHTLLLSLLEREWEDMRRRAEQQAILEARWSKEEREPFRSRHPLMHQVEVTIQKVKDLDVPVLITGETGTGKEVTARRIHYESVRKDRPFIEINCAAIPETLLESELFGHERGAFTGAVERTRGKFEQAGRGTLFLDEIGEMSLAMQAKLLHVLEERTFHRIGGSRPLTAECRIIAATNAPIERRVEEGLFRSDLFYRLKVIHIHLPPLRERKEDILPLAYLFLKEARLRYHRKVEGFTPEVERALVSYTWPGNIRQLKNVITNAVLLAEGPLIDRIDLPRAPGSRPSLKEGETLPEAVRRHTRELERALIEDALRRTGYHISETARLLGISRKTLYHRIREYGL